MQRDYNRETVHVALNNSFECTTRIPENTTYCIAVAYFFLVYKFGWLVWYFTMEMGQILQLLRVFQKLHGNMRPANTVVHIVVSLAGIKNKHCNSIGLLCIYIARIAQ